MRFIAVDPEAFNQSCYCRILCEAFPGSSYEPLASSREALRLRDQMRLDLVVFNMDVMDCSLTHFIHWFRESTRKIWLIGTTRKIDQYLLHSLRRERPDTLFFRPYETWDSLASYAKQMLCDGVAADPILPFLLKGKPIDPSQWEAKLSQRELELIGDLAAAKTDFEVAKKYGLSRNTIKNHRASIIRKLSLASNLELVRVGLEKGFSKLGPDAQLRSTTAADKHIEGWKQNFCVKIRRNSLRRAARPSRARIETGKMASLAVRPKDP